MIYQTPSTKRFPKITIDRTKCTVPFLCKKCLLICPMMVFDVDRVLEKEKRLEEVDPRIDGNYVLCAARYDKCSACNLCIEVCPVGALQVDVPKQEREQPKVNK